jgi:hypothetical protein
VRTRDQLIGVWVILLLLLVLLLGRLGGCG